MGFYPNSNGRIMKGDSPPIKNITTPNMVLRLFESIIPEVMIIIPINASMGGIMWEKISEL
jgi:hypothetical protein